MTNDDLIRRGVVIDLIDLAEHDAEERDWRSGANEIARLRKYVAALPAVTPQPTIAAALDLPEIAALVDVGFLDLITDAIAEAEKAIRKFPQPNYVITKFAEEAGEVVKAAIHCAEARETAENLRGEMKQSIAMLYRLWVEGDQVHGLPPISDTISAIEGAKA